jgi:3-oxo-5-alpha-steroid 4-dehydrogenase 1
MPDPIAAYRVLLALSAALAAVSFAALLRRPAPYGRYAGAARGPRVPARWGWVVMESPAVVVMVTLFAVGRNRGSLVAEVFLAIWLLHYVRRTLVYPFRLPRSAQPIPLSIVVTAFVFQLLNVYLHGRWLFELLPPRPDAWLADPRFVLGTALFAAGTTLNVGADETLLRLRAKGPGYRVPEGGLFRWISAPHYLGEIAIWLGWALLTWCLPALLFAFWTIANLAPRARSHHRHCLETIAGYPRQRKALVPRIW